MGSRRYTYATTLAYSTGDVPEADEVEVEVSFTVAWGSPETGNYGPPEHYDPGCPDEVGDLKLLSVDGVGGPFDQHDEAAILQAIAQNHTEAMLSAANDIEEAWAPDEDYRREVNW